MRQIAHESNFYSKSLHPENDPLLIHRMVRRGESALWPLGASLTHNLSFLLFSSCTRPLIRINKYIYGAVLARGCSGSGFYPKSDCARVACTDRDDQRGLSHINTLGECTSASIMDAHTAAGLVWAGLRHARDNKHNTKYPSNILCSLYCIKCNECAGNGCDFRALGCCCWNSSITHTTARQTHTQSLRRIKCA